MIIFYRGTCSPRGATRLSSPRRSTHTRTHTQNQRVTVCPQSIVTLSPDTILHHRSLQHKTGQLLAVALVQARVHNQRSRSAQIELSLFRILWSKTQPGTAETWCIFWVCGTALTGSEFAAAVRKRKISSGKIIIIFVFRCGFSL